MKARVILSGGNPIRQIDVSMEEYKGFIQEQATLLGITNSIDSIKDNSLKSISILCPPNMGRTTSKNFMDEFLKELNKTERRND